MVDYAAPQVAGLEQPYRSAIREQVKGRTAALEDLAVELLARGLSTRDIAETFTDERGRQFLSRTAVSGHEVGAPRQVTKRLWEEYQAFAERDLSEYEIAYLFVDGIAERIRPG